MLLCKQIKRKKKPTTLGKYLFINSGCPVQCNTIRIEWYGPGKYRLNLTDRTISGAKCFKIEPKVRFTVYLIKFYLITGPVRSKNNMKPSVWSNFGL
jgi:hypothetical protein